MGFDMFDNLLQMTTIHTLHNHIVTFEPLGHFGLLWWCINAIKDSIQELGHLSALPSTHNIDQYPGTIVSVANRKS